jgi:hypothetical protein
MNKKNALQGFIFGLGLALALPLLSGYAGSVLPISRGGTGSASRTFVQTTGNETIAGVKTFSSAPVMSGAGITSGTIPDTAITGSMLVKTNQANTWTSGLQTFNSSLLVTPTGVAGSTITRIWSAAKTEDFGSVVAGDFKAFAMTVTGVVVTDRIISWQTDMLNTSGGTSSYEIYPVAAFVTNSNEVTVVLGNLDNLNTRDTPSADYSFLFARLQ